MESLILEHPQLAPFVVSNVKSTGKIIGTGSFGKVEEVAIPGAVCVAKHIHSFLQEGRQHGQKLSPEFVKECKIMSNLRHPHIVQLLGVCVLHDSTDSVSTVPAILMEKMMTSLHDFLEPETDQSPSPEPPPKPFIHLSLKRSILQNVASGLTYLHEQSPPIIHRDLSARNVLLNSGMVAKIADMGMARIIESMGKAASMTKAPGANLYMPPEALAACPGDVHRARKDRDKKATYDSSIDVFSFGVVSIFVLSHTFPCNLLTPTYRQGSRHIARTELERREEYMKIIYQQLDKQHPLVQMIKKCLDFPENRPSALHIMETLKQASTDAGDKQESSTSTESEEYQKLKSEADTARVEAKSALETLASMKSKVEKLTLELDKSKEERRRQEIGFDIVNEEAERRQKLLEYDVKSLQQRRDKMEKIYAVTHEKNIAYKKQIEELKKGRESSSKLGQEVAQLKEAARLKDEDMQEIMEDQEQMKGKFLTIQAKCEELQKLYDGLLQDQEQIIQEQLGANNLELKKLQEEVKVKTAQIEQMKKGKESVAELQQEVARLKVAVQLKGEQNLEFKKLQEEVRARTGQVVQYKKRMDAMTIQAKCEELQKLNDGLLQDQEQAIQEQLGVNDLELKKLQEEVKVKTAQVTQYKKQLEQKQGGQTQQQSKDIELLEGKLASSQTKIEETEKELEALITKHSEMLKHYEKKTHDMDGVVAKMRAHNQHLQDRLSEANVRQKLVQKERELEKTQAQQHQVEMANELTRLQRDRKREDEFSRAFQEEFQAHKVVQARNEELEKNLGVALDYLDEMKQKQEVLKQALVAHRVELPFVETEQQAQWKQHISISHNLESERGIKGGGAAHAANYPVSPHMLPHSSNFQWPLASNHYQLPVVATGASDISQKPQATAPRSRLLRNPAYENDLPDADSKPYPRLGRK